MHRPTLGVIALISLLLWLALWIWPTGWEGNETFRAGVLRVGLVLGALWLALPQLAHVPAWLTSLVVAALALIAWRPKLAILIIPLLALFALLRPRRGKGP